MNINIVRDTKTPVETLGHIQAGEVTHDYLERPDLDDQPMVSCIPCGSYALEPHISGHLHEDDGVTPLHTYAFVNHALGVFHHGEDVPAGYDGAYPVRVECLFHPADFVEQLEGCGAPGLSRGQLPNGVWRMNSSRPAFHDIRDQLGIGATGHTALISEE